MVTGNNHRGERRVVVGMSGGVDSAVAAALLSESGFQVHGVMLTLWQAPFAAEATTSSSHAVAEALGIPLTTLDVRERFRYEVVEPWLQDYTRGLTPNPCVSCNPTLKFAVLLEFADQVGAQWIATGHYARLLRQADGTVTLHQALDPQRDQAYMLYRLNQSQLARLHLPLGDMTGKNEVRALAARLNLPNADRSDSQDLCFLSGGDYRQLLQVMRPGNLIPGPILDQQGNVLGQHSGLPLYTVGQRSGLGLALGTPHFVLELRPAENALIVGPAQALQRNACKLDHLTFTSETPPASPLEVKVRVRYRAPQVPATVELWDSEQARVTFSTPQRAIAPGQSVVFYDDDRVIGGGFISP